MKTQTSRLSKILAMVLMVVILFGITMPIASAYEVDNYADEQISLQWLAPEATNIFPDVPNRPNWQNDPVSWAYRNNITSGVGGGRFNPSGRLSREMFATFLHRIAGTPTAAAANFPDQGSINGWATPAVNWASSIDVIGGFPDGTFGPQRNIQRQQIAAMLFRYAEHLNLDTTAPAGVLAGFADNARVGAWANEAMRWAVHNGLITGMNGLLAPTNNATRAQTVAMLQRFVETFNIPTPPGGGGGTPPVGTHVLTVGPYIVGEDIPAGRYTVTALPGADGRRNTGNFVVRNDNNVWPAPGLVSNEILNSAWGEVRNGRLDLHGTPTVTVTLNVGYRIEINSPIGFQFAPPITPATNTLTTGRWIVGVHIAAGEYTATLTRPEMEAGLAGSLIINNADWTRVSTTRLSGNNAESSVRVNLQAGQHVHVELLDSVTFTP